MLLIYQSRRTLKSTGEVVIVEMNFNNYKVLLDQDADTVQIIPSDEHHEYMWADVSELKNLNLSQPSIECLAELGYL